MMELAEFHNTIRKLYNVDHHVIPWMSDADWPKFRDDPVRFFIRADDATADRLWDLIKPRDASAPDLLTALKLLVADVADYEPWQRPCHALDVARAAIAKATP